MDTLRGLSIVLVVINHSFVFTYEDLASAPAWLVAFNSAFSPLRMPLMVFLSGLLVPLSLRKSTRRYAAGKLKNVLHPYLVWSAIMILILAAASVLIGRPFDTALILRVFYWPIEHLWFIAYLLVFYAVALATKSMEPLLVAVPAGLIAFIPLGGEWPRFWVLLCFFMLGITAARHGDRWERILNQTAWAWAGTVMFLVLLRISTQIGELRYEPAVIPLVLVCVVAACIAGRALGSPQALHHLRYVGRESLIYYVVHWPVILVSFVALRQTMPGVPDLVTFCVGIVIAFVASTAMALAAARLAPVSWLFRFGEARLAPHAIRS
ncbi:acyltransferase family protein [Kocuria sp. LHG3120]|uniref:acyltransferase family protein n=1 Tax=Kocuria sp. LHG3120 TaxID=2804590 RepID=UPI003CEC6D8F